MHSLRSRIGDHPRLAALIVAAALLLRVLVPGGFMPDFSSGGFRIVICTGFGAARMPTHMAGMHGGTHAAAHHGSGHDEPGHNDGGDQQCGFGGLLAPGLAGADPIQLALALLFIISLTLFAAPVLRVGRLTRLRPPLRGPPATA